MTSNTRSNSTGGCGCAGAPSHTASAAPGASKGCTCKECCDVCQDQGYARPHFFAGQLLTEEDLEQLTQYVVGKNRLHNRHLWGDGVVCGLEVKSHPCGGGRVIVEPGYALDCCGNDIVLPCAKTLDINAMVRKLREKMLGYDCGDPCKERDRTAGKTDAVKEALEAARAKSLRINLENQATAPAATANPNEPPKREPVVEGSKYGLYIFYCEQKTDAVTPYSTGESCGSQACVETRIREGFGFDLRCWKEPERPGDIATRICDCVKAAAECETPDEQTKLVDRHIMQLQNGIRAMETGPPAFRMETMTAAVQELKAALPAAAALKTVDAEKVRALSEAARDVAMEAARYYATEPAKQPDAATAGVSAAHELLAEARKVLEKPEVIAAQAKMTELERSYVGAVAESARRLAKPLDAAAVKRPEVTALAGGLVYSRELENKLRQTGEKVSDAFTAAEAETPVSVPRMGDRTPAESAMTPGRLKELLEFTKGTSAALRRNLTKCLCASANPPCQPCEDPGVLLASITVKDCEVVDICYLERKWVITPVALRYWVPEIGIIGRYLALMCCMSVTREGAAEEAEAMAAAKGLVRTPLLASVLRLIRPELMALLKTCLQEQQPAPATAPAPPPGQVMAGVVRKEAKARVKQPAKG